MPASVPRIGRRALGRTPAPASANQEVEMTAEGAAPTAPVHAARLRTPAIPSPTRPHAPSMTVSQAAIFRQSGCCKGSPDREAAIERSGTAASSITFLHHRRVARGGRSLIRYSIGHIAQGSQGRRRPDISGVPRPGSRDECAGDRYDQPNQAPCAQDHERPRRQLHVVRASRAMK